MVSHRTRPAIQVSALLILICTLLIGAGHANADARRWKLEGWKTDFSKTIIDFKEVFSGGPPKDGIPAIDNPRFEPLSSVSNLTDKEPVVSLSINGDARAYPIRILMWHEIVNDTIGGQPVTITYCPLCNSAIAFDRRVNDQVLDFGTTGKLRNSDLVMYDRATESWWQQFTGEAVVGTMLGQTLKMLPARLESFSQFKARERVTSDSAKVLVPNNPSARRYGENPYVGYDRSARPFLYQGAMPDGINPMARVVAVRTKSAIVAVTLELLRKNRRHEQSGITLSWVPGQTSALDTRAIAKGRDVGTVTASSKKSDGRQTLVPYDVTFAFAFHAFHPEVAITTK